MPLAAFSRPKSVCSGTACPARAARTLGCSTARIFGGCSTRAASYRSRAELGKSHWPLLRRHLSARCGQVLVWSPVLVRRVLANLPLAARRGRALSCCNGENYSPCLKNRGCSRTLLESEFLGGLVRDCRLNGSAAG